MSNNNRPIKYPVQARVYQIRIEGHLGPEWMDWFEGLTLIQAENGETLLTGPVIDQAALYGLLKKVRDLGMFLVAVNRIGPFELEELAIQQIHKNHSKGESDVHR
jgi:hypothetical protein